MRRTLICAGIGLVTVTGLASAQRQSRDHRLRLPDIAEAVRARPVAPRVDGVLDDEAWRLAPRFADFTQRDPDEGHPATEATEFRVVYTDDALFVAIRAHDSRPSEIAAILTRRDGESPSDEVTIMIDSYLDRRTGFSFSVNAAGVKRDAYLFNDTERDERWDAVWDVATTVDGGGWTAEFRIPFSQLRFPASDVNTFGFNVSRRINRLNEMQYWRPVPKDASGNVSRFGDLVGIDGIVPPRRIEVAPYTVARTTRGPAVLGDPFRTGVAHEATVGADIKYGINSAFTLTATVNPDFGQVEADPAVVNLSAFETFFPERRPFFTEGLDIFRFRIRDGDGEGSEEELFYTRRIGRRPQGGADPRGGYAESVDHTTIVAAGKLSGKTQSGWTMGVTGALTDEEGARVLDAAGQTFRDVVEPRSGYVVGRLSREMRDGQTVVGLFGTTVQRSLSANLEYLHARAYTGGVNWSHRFLDNTYAFNGRVVGSRVSGSAEAITRTQSSSARYFQRPDADHLALDSTRTSLGGLAAAMNFGRTAGNVRWSVGFDTRTPGLETNDIGFQREADYFSSFIWLNRRWLQPGKIFRRFNVNFNAWSSWTYGGERRNTGGNVNVNYTLLNYWNGWFGINRQFGGLNTGQLRGGPAITQPASTNGWVGFQSDGRNVFRGGGTAWVFLQDENDNWGAGVDANLSWRVLSNFDVTASPNLRWNRDQWQYLETRAIGGRDEFLFGELRQTTVGITFRSNMTFSPTLSLQMYGQPFVSSGDYVGFTRVVQPRAARFADRFETLAGNRAQTDGQGNLEFDLTGDGAFDAVMANPDFTVVSFRSNLVLRWEYKLGSTMFLVWQHGRSGFQRDGRFRLGRNVDRLFQADAENVLLFKINYWLSR